MSYDLDPSECVPLPPFPPADPTDLEALVTLLELAALSLTNGPDSTFTEAQLLAEVRKVAGEFEFEERDLKIVLDNSGFLKKARGLFRLR